jgi:diguanylate cyclase (GGDEF)-like protein/PAS domain S-box-containing protein
MSMALFRSSRPARLVVALLLFALVTTARFASDNAADAIGILFVVPVAMVALDFHWRGGLLAAALAIGLMAMWAKVANSDLTVIGYATRTAAFVIVGAGIGVISAQRERSVRAAARWFSMSNDLLCTASFAGYFTTVNESWTTLLGYTREELLAQPFESFVHPDDIERTRACATGLAIPSEVVNFENRYRAKDGSWHWLLWSARSDGKRIYAAVKDVTERKRQEAEREELLATVEEMARTDGLTGVMNRAAWREQLAEELTRAGRVGSPTTVLMLDLDHFKTVNDTHGHAGGDRLLKACTAGWGGVLRGLDELGRLGGDEFAVLLPTCDIHGGRRVAERLRACTSTLATCSIGVASWDGSETDEALLHRADEALYRAKQGGRDQLEV